ncbi:putative disease resistance protein (TIR-NBS-LRR class) [Melia azedarach]|uniref:Disease resistance protein (TIR-NBS-LRR class) n=1 Tax=Melia azedarach TaxID=155640 RepID=A0ACC1YJ44_MELAZ|nr:putative disease resistance protein (TIR-NBS-LRR class) [Melia azedarach]
MASSASSSSSLPVKIPQAKYDVFLSFRGEDTRDNFISHLYAALHRKQIQTFIDNQLIRGDEISESFRSAIESSIMSVIVFSEGYASSGWCLDELVKILECRNLYGQIVIPVFYHVNPSHVRNQTGVFGDLFSKLEERFQERLDKLWRWRIALWEVANLSGFNSDVIRPESELIEKIVKDILRRLSIKFGSYYKGDLVGVESIIEEIGTLLTKESTNVYTLGIWGIGGIGKTTIAKAIFSEISSQFEGSYFIENVREQEDKRTGLDRLWEELFSTLLGDENVKIDVPNNLFNFVRLSRKKVLIVFDDVSDFKQIESLIENFHYFGGGSQLIITTRDKHVLERCRVNTIYQVKELLGNDALKLFSQHAFRQNRPNVDYERLSNKIIEYAHGVPLALKVLGGFLFRRTKEEWESTIKKLKRIPNEDIQKVLKISYDGLDDVCKNSFLDIACLFKEKDRGRTMEILDAYGFYADIGIAILVDKCLITVLGNMITMHDLLQEMGMEIVRQESINDPGKRTRLWHHEDIYEVLTCNSNLVKLKCMDLSHSKQLTKLPDLSKAQNLKELILAGCSSLVETHSSIQHLNKLVFVNLRECESLKSLPPSIQSKSLEQFYLWGCINLKRFPDISSCNLEELDLSGTGIEELSSSIECLTRLHTLDLRNCSRLKQLPKRLCKLKSLEYLNLSNCSNLEKLPDELGNVEESNLSSREIEELSSSIGCLTRLVTLDLSNCSRLQQLPRGLCKLKSLNYLYLSGCLNLQRLPDEFGNLEQLRKFHAERIAIREFPSSTVCLKHLVELSFKGFRVQEHMGFIWPISLSLDGLHSLTSLKLSDCSITELPESLGQLSSLKELYLDKNNFERIPESIINLPNLRCLYLRYCKRLQCLPRLPCSLNIMNADDCISLEALSGLPSLFTLGMSNNYFQQFHLKNCHKLDGNELSEIVQNAQQKIQLISTASLEEQALQVHVEESWGYMYYPGSEIPEWFEFQSMGSSITSELPQSLLNNKVVGFAFCAVVAFEELHYGDQDFNFLCKWKVKTQDGQWDVDCVKAFYPWDSGNVDSDHVLLGYLLLRDYIRLDFDEQHYTANEVSFQLNGNYFGDGEVDCSKAVKKCGINVLYGQDFRKSKQVEIPEIRVLHFYDEESKKDRSGSFSDEEEEPHYKRFKYSTGSFWKN